MITAKGPFLQLIWTALTFVLVLAALSMIWPSIMALFVGLLLLLRYCHTEQDVAVLSWTEIANSLIVFAL